MSFILYKFSNSEILNIILFIILIVYFKYQYYSFVC